MSCWTHFVTDSLRSPSRCFSRSQQRRNVNLTKQRRHIKLVAKIGRSSILLSLLHSVDHVASVPRSLCFVVPRSTLRHGFSASTSRPSALRSPRQVCHAL